MKYNRGEKSGLFTRNGVPEVLLEPSHQRVEGVEVLLSISQSVRGNGDVLVPWLYSGHVR